MSERCNKQHTPCLPGNTYTCTRQAGHLGKHRDNLYGFQWPAWYPASDVSGSLLDKYRPPYKAVCDSRVWTLQDADDKVIMEAAEDSYGWSQPVRELADLLNELAEKAGLV